MLELVLGTLCVIGVGYLILMLKSYYYMSIPELKRQARAGSRAAKAVYSVRGVYGSQLLFLVWSIVGTLVVAAVMLFDSRLWGGFVALLAVPLSTILCVAVPRLRHPSPGLGIARLSVPVIGRVLRVTRLLLSPLDKLAGKLLQTSEVRQLHSKDELLDVLEHTQIENSAFSKDELSIAVHALTFGDKQITEIMTPRSIVKYVRATDILSPVLLGELHESGFSRFPVIESEKGDYVGVLYSKDLGDLRANKSVHEVMRQELYYVNEFTSLDNVLNAFLRTQHHLFMVVNEFEEVVGIVTIEDVLEQIIGRKIVDEFDQYADLRAVARQLARKDAVERLGERV